MEDEKSLLQQWFEPMRAVDREIQQLPDAHYAPLGSILTDVEWYSLTAIVKTSSNVHAFCEAISAKNSVAAGATLRSQLDAAQRIFGLTIVEGVEDAGRILMHDGHYAKLKDRRTGKELRDSYLNAELAKAHPWVAAAYKAACMDVHLTASAIKRKMVARGSMLFFNLDGLDRSFEPEFYRELASDFQNALQLTRDLLKQFMETRPGPEERMKEVIRIRSGN